MNIIVPFHRFEVVGLIDLLVKVRWSASPIGGSSVFVFRCTEMICSTLTIYVSFSPLGNDVGRQAVLQNKIDSCYFLSSLLYMFKVCSMNLSNMKGRSIQAQVWLELSIVYGLVHKIVS